MKTFILIFMLSITTLFAVPATANESVNAVCQPWRGLGESSGTFRKAGYPSEMIYARIMMEDPGVDLWQDLAEMLVSVVWVETSIYTDDVSLGEITYSRCQYLAYNWLINR